MAGATTLSIAGAVESACNEAIVLQRYLDSKNIWTIGIGHTAAAGGLNPATYTGVLTIEQAVELFMDVDAPRYVRDVLRAVKVPLTQHELDALFDFHYNTGAIARASLTKALNAGNRAACAAGFMQWKKPVEIIERRERSRDLFLTGRYEQRYALLLPVNARNKPDWGKGRRVDMRALLSNGKTTIQLPNAGVPQTPVAPPVSRSTYITLNATGADVVAWQEQLLAMGYNLAHGADGDFGKGTLAATKAFQRDARIMVDGRVGSGTRAAAAKRLAEMKRDAATAVVEPVLPTPVGTVAPGVVVHSDGSIVVAHSDGNLVVEAPSVEQPAGVETAQVVAVDTANAGGVDITAETVNVTTEPATSPVPAYEIVQPGGTPVVPNTDITPTHANPNSGETSIGATSIKQVGIGGIIVVALTALLNWIGG